MVIYLLGKLFSQSSELFMPIGDEELAQMKRIEGSIWEYQKSCGCVIERLTPRREQSQSVEGRVIDVWYVQERPGSGELLRFNFNGSRMTVARAKGDLGAIKHHIEQTKEGFAYAGAYIRYRENIQGFMDPVDAVVSMERLESP